MKSSSPKEEKHNFFGYQTITAGAVTIAIFTIVSKILGLFRDRLFAAKFLISKADGIHQSLDVYYAAFFVPDTVYYLLFLGALAASFIPIFTAYISNKKEKEAFYLANSFLNISLVSLFLISLVVFALAPYLIKIIAPGFEPEKQRLTASLMRLMLLSPILFAISNTAGGILNSYKRFTVYALAPCLYNLGIILGTLFFYQKWGVYAPAIGVLMGAFLHMAIQFGSIFPLGFRYQPILDIKHQAIKKIYRLMLPRVAALAVDRVNLWIQVLIASTLAIGSVSIVNLSNNLESFPVSIFGIAVATAAFPFLAEAVSLNKNQEFIKNLSTGLSYIFYLIIPTSLAMILLRAQIVRIILGAGHFSWTDTRLTAASLGVFSVSLFAQGVIPLLCRSFYALKDTLTPLKLAIISILVNILGSILFTRNFFIAPLLSFLKLTDHLDARVVGLALAFTLSSILYMFLLYFKLKTKTGPFDKGLLKTVYKIILASMVAGVFIQIGKYLIGSLISLEKGINVAIQFTGAVLLGILVYLFLTKIMGLKEAEQIIQKVKNILTKGV